jgi:RNA polymerase sigma factor (sigma-70 family)
MLFEMVISLKEEQREALLLHYIEEMKIAEISVIMGRSEGAVNSLLQRARANLYRMGKGYFLDRDEVRDESK